jgi:hypothetical protein
MAEIHVRRGVTDLAADVPAVPVSGGRAQALAAAKSREIGKISCPRAGGCSEHKRCQQKSTHRHTPSNTLTFVDHRSLTLTNRSRDASIVPILLENRVRNRRRLSGSAAAWGHIFAS